MKIVEMTVLALGSNVGDRLQHITQALKTIHGTSPVRAISPIYETEPIACEGGWFYNMVAIVDAREKVEDFLKILLDIERHMGRNKEKGPKEERIIDIDLLFFGGTCVNTKKMRVPHPRIKNRRFVLAPLCDLTPDFVHPIFNKTVRQLYAEIDNHDIVVKTDMSVSL